MAEKKLQGQIGLILLVVMGVALALILSVASRSLSDTVISRQERESSAAFSLAETGVENALHTLQQGTVPSGTIPFQDTAGLVTGSYTVTPQTTYTLFVKEGEVAQLDLSTFVSSISIKWTLRSSAIENIAGCTEGSGGTSAALEVDSMNGTVAKRSYFNPAECPSLSSTNGFTTIGTNASTTIYRSFVTYAVPSGTTVVRIRPLYAPATLSVSSATTTALGSQLYLIQSSAAGGDAQKQIQVTRGLDAPSSVFDFAVFSGSTIVKTL